MSWQLGSSTSAHQALAYHCMRAGGMSPSRSMSSIGHAEGPRRRQRMGRTYYSVAEPVS